MNLLDWTDRRLDDLRDLVIANDKLLDDVRAQTQTNQDDIKELTKDVTMLAQHGDRRSDRGFQFVLVLAAWIPAITIIILSLTGSVH